MNDLSAYINAPVEIERELTTLFARDAPLVVFVIGACTGEDSIKYATLFPNARVYAFEPRPDNVEQMRRNLVRFDRPQVQVVDLALSNRAGTSTLYVSSGSPEGTTNSEHWNYGNKSSSLLPPNVNAIKKRWNWLRFEDEITVRADTLESFCAGNNIDHIDFVHLDVQGAEVAVLEGAADYIHRIRAIWLEAHTVEFYRGQCLKDDLQGFMRSKGFVKVLDTVRDDEGDLLYVARQGFMDVPVLRLRAMAMLRWLGLSGSRRT